MGRLLPLGAKAAQSHQARPEEAQEVGPCQRGTLTSLPSSSTHLLATRSAT